MKQNMLLPMKLKDAVRNSAFGCRMKHILVPLLGLLVGSLVRRPGVGEDETSERVTTLVSTMGVHLSSTVILLEVDLRLVKEANNLNVVRGLHELDTGNGTRRNETSTVAGLGAVSDGLSFDAADDTVGLRRTPDTPV